MNGISNGNVLQGRTAIITGASQGLGLEIAMQYVVAGASVIICARDESMLSEAAEVLKRSASHDQVIFHMVADVAESEAVDALIDFANGDGHCLSISPIVGSVDRRRGMVFRSPA